MTTPNTPLKPCPWETFGRMVLERFCEGDCVIDMMDIQEWAEEAGTLVPVEGGFDPEEHVDLHGFLEPGDLYYFVLPESDTRPQVKVKPLPRHDGQENGWTLPPNLLLEIQQEVTNEGWDTCMEVVEIVALATERRILSALGEQ